VMVSGNAAISPWASTVEFQKSGRLATGSDPLAMPRQPIGEVDGHGIHVIGEILPGSENLSLACPPSSLRCRLTGPRGGHFAVNELSWSTMV